jgi:predicted alpha/beta-hydrolase family hydrolase
VSYLYEPAVGEQRGIFICAHGAGGSMIDRSMAAVAKLYRSIGLGVVRFNFPYKERGSGRPDPMPVLEGSVAQIIAQVHADHAPPLLLIGGRSMGGRACSMLLAQPREAAESRFPDGMILLAYPLHPAGQPAKLRDAHLGAIAVPTIIFNGTRDDLCQPDLMIAALERANNPHLEMRWLQGADHSFHVLKSSGRTDAMVLEDVGRESQSWLSRLSDLTRAKTTTP